MLSLKNLAFLFHLPLSPQAPRSYQLSNPQLCHSYKEDDTLDVIGLLWHSSKIIYGKLLAQYLAHNKSSINGGFPWFYRLSICKNPKIHVLRQWFSNILATEICIKQNCGQNPNIQQVNVRLIGLKWRWRVQDSPCCSLSHWDITTESWTHKT